MSLAGRMLDNGSEPRIISIYLISPHVRTALIAIVVAVHAIVLFKLSARIPTTPLPAISIEITMLPEIASPPSPESEPVPTESPQQIAEPAPAPVEEVPDEAQPADIPKVDEIAPATMPEPEPVLQPAPTPVKPVEPARPRQQKPKKVERARAPAVSHATPSGSAVARVQGANHAPAAAPAISAASYAAMVAGELNRHKSYPEAARASGTGGSVGIAFTIGPSGSASAISITSSSGSAVLDSAARQAVASIRVPPPPGGIFRTATTIRFSLR